jgi:hypothetical protein
VVSPVWPGGTLTLVRRVPPPAGSPNGPVSTYRVTKGDRSILVVVSFTSDGKIAALGLQPDRDYL